jgi:Methyltransferase small domain
VIPLISRITSLEAAMMGRQTGDQASLFYEFRLDDRIPKDHLLRRINVVIGPVLDGVRGQLKPYYSEIGRPSVDPELMIRMLIVGYCFSLLGFGLCDTLCLADINPDAVRACRRTIDANGLKDRVAVYRSNNLDDIPTTERWDPVVGNPPHFDWAQVGERRFADSGWNIHRRFFETVGRFLKASGVILIQENNHGSTVETFRQMIEEAGYSICIAVAREATCLGGCSCAGRFRRGQHAGAVKCGDTL